MQTASGRQTVALINEVIILNETSSSIYTSSNRFVKQHHLSLTLLTLYISCYIHRCNVAINIPLSKKKIILETVQVSRLHSVIQLKAIK